MSSLLPHGLRLCEGGGHRGQWKDLIKLAIDKLNRYLNPGYAMFSGEIDCLLRMLKVESLERIGCPIPEPAEIQLRAGMLQQDFH